MVVLLWFSRKAAKQCDDSFPPRSPQAVVVHTLRLLGRILPVFTSPGGDGEELQMSGTQMQLQIFKINLDVTDFPSRPLNSVDTILYG